MKITVNRKIHDFEGDSKVLLSVLEDCDLPLKGIAVALNNKVVPKEQWSAREVKDGDNITVIQAVCGG